MTDSYASAPIPSGNFRVGDVFSTSFSIFGRRFLAFLILAVVIFIPVIAFGLIVGGGALAADATAAFGVTAVIAVFLTIAAQIATQGASLFGVVQEARGQAFSIGEAISAGLRSILPLLGVAIVTGILIAIGTLLLVVPGLILMCMFYVVAPVCVAERAGVFGSISRSVDLTKGYRWQIFGIVVVLWVAGFAISYVSQRIFLPMGVAGYLITQLLTIIVTAFGAVVTGVSYYRLRVAKEGIDISQIARVFD